MLDKDFKDLVEEFSSKNSELLKQKDAYTYEHMNSFERFNEENISLVQLVIMINYQTVT